MRTHPRLLQRLAVVGVSLFIACTDPAAPPPERRAELGGSMVAMVGEAPIAQETAGRVARAQSVSLERARELAVSDALFALHGQETLPKRQLRVIQRAELARALYRELELKARAQGKATDSEVAALTEARWLTLDRPASVRTSHAVVLVEKGTDPAGAEALAKRIHEATKQAKDAASFERAAKAVPAVDLNVRVEALPAVTADGRVIDLDNPPPPGMRFDAEYSRAANAIEGVGKQSPVTRTPFGFHVIFAAEVLPAVSVPLEERRVLLAEEVIKRRIQLAERALMQQAEQQGRVEVSRAAETLTGELRVRP